MRKQLDSANHHVRGEKIGPGSETEILNNLQANLSALRWVGLPPHCFVAAVEDARVWGWSRRVRIEFNGISTWTPRLRRCSASGRLNARR